MKKIYFCCIFFLALITTVFAQNSNLKHYSDSAQDFEGWASSWFLANITESTKNVSSEDIIKLLSEKVGGTLKPVSKLTKNNSWLMEKALDEWEYEKGEIYGIACVDSYFAKEGLLIFVIIDEKKNKKWLSYLVDENDLDDMQNIFDD